MIETQDLLSAKKPGYRSGHCVALLAQLWKEKNWINLLGNALEMLLEDHLYI